MDRRDAPHGIASVPFRDAGCLTLWRAVSEWFFVVVENVECRYLLGSTVGETIVIVF
jgi:hypothetical protein